eukprot:scaffold65444_cov59-Phaeocystis_antarctica.AAC.3
MTAATVCRVARASAPKFGGALLRTPDPFSRHGRLSRYPPARSRRAPLTGARPRAPYARKSVIQGGSDLGDAKPRSPGQCSTIHSAANL